MADVQVGFSESTGKYFVKLPGNLVQEVTPAQAAQIRENPGFASNLLGSAGEMAKNTLLGAGSLMGDGWSKQELERSNQELAARSMQSPVSTLAGQAAPALAVGAATAGAGIVPTVAAEALLGAAQSPEAPLEGAALGGAFGLVPFAAPVARASMKAAGAALPDLADPFLRNVPMSGAVAGQPRMAGRVLQNIDAAAPDAVPGQFYKGLMKSSELEQAGVPMTPAMRTALDATDSAQADFAKRQLWRESIQGVGDQEKRAQRLYMTKLVKNEMGVTDDVALTDTVIGDVLKAEGGKIGQILGARGPIDLPLETLTSMRGVVDRAESGWQNSLSNVVKNVEKNIAQNGALTPQGYQNAITELGKIGAPGRSAGAIQDAKELRDFLAKPVEGALSKAEKQLLAEARYRYKIAKTLKQGAGVGSDMMVNPKSFGSNWDRKLAQTARGRDTIGRAADTMNFLSTMEANAGTTLQRVFASAPGAMQKAAPGAIGAALGVTGLGGLVNGLSGN